MQVVEAALLEDLHKEVMQLKETLSLVDSQRQELQASIEQEQQYEQQLLAVHEKLQVRQGVVESQMRCSVQDFAEPGFTLIYILLKE